MQRTTTGSNRSRSTETSGHDHRNPQSCDPGRHGRRDRHPVSVAAIHFSRLLVTSWRQAVFKYGDLATRIGKESEEKWMGPGARVDSSALSDPDFSATTDLYSIVSNVYNMRLTLFDYQGAIAVIVAALLPFLPVWLSVIPLKTLSKNLIGLLF